MNELLELIKNLTNECDLFLTVYYIGYMDAYVFKLGHYDNTTDRMTYSAKTIPSTLIPDILKDSKLVPIITELYKDIKEKEKEQQAEYIKADFEMEEKGD